MVHDLAALVRARPSRRIDVMDARDEALARIAALRLEAQVPLLVAALSRAGTTPIVLRGPTTLDRLSTPEERAGTSDVDLLVSPRHHRQARRTLASIGFNRVDSVAHADVLRDRDGTRIDLHLTIPSVAVGPTETWRVMCRHVLRSDLGPNRILTLDAAAHVVNLAAHVAAHRADVASRQVEELRLAVTHTEPADRDEADRIAAVLGLTAVVRQVFAGTVAYEQPRRSGRPPEAVDHGLP